MSYLNFFIFTIILIFRFSFGEETPYLLQENKKVNFSPPNQNGLGRVGDYPFPANPLLDRAKGYLLKGKAKSALLNYGNYTSWDEYPAGGWGKYSYLPNLSFIAGIAGHAYSLSQI